MKSLPRIAIITLALGVGGSTAVITVAEALLIRPLPVAREDRLALMWGETPDGRFANVPLTLDELTAFEREAQTIEQLAYHTFRGATADAFRVGDQVFQLRLSLVSGNYFEVLGSRPALGRSLGPADDVKGMPPGLVLSHRAWQQRFGGDSSVVGRSIALARTGRSYRVIGVMPPGLEYPRGTEVWAPLTAYSVAEGSFELASNELDIVARLAEGATHAQARSELTGYFSRLPAPGWRRDVRGVVHGFRGIVLGDARPAMRIVLLAAAMLLIISCINVANLQLVRSLARVRELVVRSALGGSRGQIVRHELRESVVLAAAGGVAGVVVGVLLVKLFLAVAPPGMPRVAEVTLNGTVLLAALGISALTLVASGLAPALSALRVDAGDVLRSGARHTANRPVRLVGELLVATQVALAVVALSSAALVGRSLANLYQVDMSFDPNRLVVAELAIRQDRFAGRDQQAELVNRLVSRLEAVSGVEGVTPVLNVPFIGLGGGIDGRMLLPGQSVEELARNPIVNMEVVSPSYFRVLGVPVLTGRAFNEGDRQGTTKVVVVSSATSRALWPGKDPIGERLGGKGEFTVVGVVPDTRYRDLVAARPSVYFPLAQPFFPMTPTTLVMRGDIAASQLRQAVAEVEGDVTVTSVATLGALLEGPRAQPRLNALVLGLFASAAIALAAIGVFSIMATMVRRRTREIGIRMALGATGGAVGRMVVFRGMLIATIGTVAGILAARAVSGMLSGLLFEIAATDVRTSIFVVTGVMTVTILACLVPARASAGVDPVKALRVEG